jgi:photosystem II stability/assembly factor-like uncharacterized protein
MNTNMLSSSLVILGFLASAAVVPCLATAVEGEAAPVFARLPAERLPYSSEVSILGVATAAKRIVAVGDRGVILLSDDNGQHFRQATSVPVRSALTDVYFANDKDGWAVGQWGVILSTNDGGESWVLRRQDTTIDRPIFSVYFIDGKHGFAVGLWSLLLETNDGGLRWTERKLPKEGKEAPEGDLNFFKVFGDSGANVYIASERGFVVRSSDAGVTWQSQRTGGRGSLWAGVAGNGTVLVAGLRGAIYRSEDGGQSWTSVSSGTTNSITSLAMSGKRVIASALQGVTASSRDGGKTFVAAERSDRTDLTAIAFAPDNQIVEFSATGPVSTSGVSEK